MATEKRKPPGRKMREKFAKNRIRRRFIDLEIAELQEKLASTETVKTALKTSLEIERLKSLKASLAVRRRPQNGRKKKTGGTFGGLF